MKRILPLAAAIVLALSPVLAYADTGRSTRSILMEGLGALAVGAVMLLFMGRKK